MRWTIFLLRRSKPKYRNWTSLLPNYMQPFRLISRNIYSMLIILYVNTFLITKQWLGQLESLTWFWWNIVDTKKYGFQLKFRITFVSFVHLKLVPAHHKEQLKFNLKNLYLVWLYPSLYFLVYPSEQLSNPSCLNVQQKHFTPPLHLSVESPNSDRNHSSPTKYRSRIFSQSMKE